MDTESSRTWLKKMGKSMPNTLTHERTEMATGNAHREMPGFGVMYYEEEKVEKGPDYKGFLILAMDYKAGEKLKIACWQKPTSRGHNLLSIKEDNWAKKKREEGRQDKEVEPRYERRPATKSRNDDDDVPF